MHRNPDLEAAVVRAPDDATACLVYADWLSEQADPWGELIALQCAGAGDAARIAMLQQAEVRAALSVVPLPEDLRLTWERGFVVGVRLRRTRATTPALWPMLEALLVARCTVAVRSLDVALGQFGETPRRFTDALNATHAAPLLRRLILRGAGAGDVGAVKAAVPRLTEVELIDGPSLELVATGPAECLTLQVGERRALDPLHRTVVGRAYTAEIVVRHPLINRSNFHVSLDEGRWVFAHLGGTHPIWFNGAPTRDQGRMLAHGDRIEPVQGLVFRFVDPP